MEEILSEEELNKLLQIQGEVRGVAFRSDADFILHETGEQGLKRLEEAMAGIGQPIKYREIRPMDFYPLKLDTISLVVLKRLFHFDDERIQELGHYLAKVSVLLRLFMKYFVSLEKMAEEVPGMWRKHYTVGGLTVASLDKKNKEMIIRLENFNPHELYCQVFKGYFCSVMQMAVGKKPICDETKCAFKNDPYHEFTIKW